MFEGREVRSFSKDLGCLSIDIKDPREYLKICSTLKKKVRGESRPLKPSPHSFDFHFHRPVFAVSYELFITKLVVVTRENAQKVVTGVSLTILDCKRKP